MCGIVAYIGKEQAYPIIIKGLSRLEYRGYDSAGVALINSKDNQLKLYKKKGKVSTLDAYARQFDIQGTVGIGHTRWATHGLPNDVNSHPHTSMDGKIAIIHNGIIENYDSIKAQLIARGYLFKSETDTEVVVHLIDDILKKEKVTLLEAVRLALSSVKGAFALVIMSSDYPDELICARRSSPLVVGIGENQQEFFVASDASPIVEYTKQVVYLNDDEIASISLKEGLSIIDIKNQSKPSYVQELEMQIDALEKGGFEHFMLKEIFEQPRSIRDGFRGRLNAEEGWVQLGGLKDYEQRLVHANRLVMVACGTSWHACQVGEYLIEDLARINVEVEYASEFRYRNPIIKENDIIIALSQSGETADTIAAINLAKEKGASVLGITNVIGSSIARNTDAGSYTHAGPEIGVASTKAFTAQVTALTLMALRLAHIRGTVRESELRRMITEFSTIPDKVQRILNESSEVIQTIATTYQDAKNALYLGRGSSFPVALEGALKLKEITYIHAEGYPAAEMKHGPIALIDEEMPVFVIATRGTSYEKVVSNIQEVKARKGKIIAIVTEGDKQVKDLADHYVEIPDTDEHFVPILATIPLQLISYYIAVLRGCDVDQPRNLAKSVTVE